MSIQTSLASFFAGFNTTYSMPLLADQEAALRRHTPPHPSLLLFVQAQSARSTGASLSQWFQALQWMKTAWLITPFLLFLPLFIHLWPRASSENPLFEQAKAVTQARLKRIHFCLHLMEKIPIKNKKLIRFLDWLDSYLFSLFFIATMTAYISLYFLGQPILALTGGLTLFLALLDKKNVLPLFFKHFIQRWGIEISLFSGLLFGTGIEQLFSLLSLPYYYGHYLKRPLIFILGKCHRTKLIADELKKQQPQKSLVPIQKPKESALTLTFINQLEQHAFRGMKPDTKSLLTDYINAIGEVLEHKNDAEVTTSTLAKLNSAFTYPCRIRLFRAIEKTYLSFAHPEEVGRHKCFKKIYYQQKLYLPSTRRDPFAYHQAIALYAPRFVSLQSVTQDELADYRSALLTDLFSAFSPIKKELQKTLDATLKKNLHLSI